jgi:hypothetical protein
MVGGVPCWIREDGHERMDPPELIVGNSHEDWEERFPDCCEVVVRGLPLEGRKVLTCLERDRFGCHDCLDGFSGDWAGSIADHYDYDQRKGIVSGKLGGLSAFGDMAESIRGCNGDGHSGLHGLFGVKLELDFNCQAATGHQFCDNPKNEEEQY